MLTEEQIVALLSTAQAAEILDVDQSRVNQWIHDGRLIPIQVSPREYFFIRRDVEEFAQIYRPSGRPPGPRGRPGH